MVKQTIQIFCRVKPTKAKSLGAYDVDEDDAGYPRLTLTIPKDVAEGLINNKKENYKFRFSKVFDQKTKQDDVFESVAKPVIDNVIGGYNGTIFAYGQTGSGKTFTITGGPERYADRGIIPRTVSYIYEYFQQNSENDYTAHISYLEIYNENGYDLLDPKHEASKLEDLPKVSLMEDVDQNIHLKNLSTHQAGSEEEALNLLFLGDTNRMIAETPMNQASTRSHCIFTIHLSCRESGSATIRRAKLHLVDLAGSERIGKTGVTGQLMAEAKYINLSLHYLEQVIVALSEKKRTHIPYRNSMMTSVLRDSLGGNCMTTMIATCSIEKKNIDESISTCRFAQRVAMIKNDAILNEELDPKLMIAKLKSEIAMLKEELAIATGEQRTDELTEEEIDRCKAAVKAFLEDTDLDATLNIGGDMRKIQLCYRIMKRHVQERPEPTQSSYAPEEPTPRVETPGANPAELKKVNDLLRQRDNEINILVNMLKKEKKRAADAINQLQSLGHSTHRPASETEVVNGRGPSHQPPPRRSASDDRLEEAPRKRPSSGRKEKRREQGEPDYREHRQTREQREPSVDPKEERAKHQILGEMSMGRNEAFEIFKRDYDHNQKIDDQKAMLKQRYSEAKSLGENVNQARGKINHIRAKIEQHRMSLAMQGLIDPDNPEPDETEQKLREKIEHEKDKYKTTFNRLRSMKTEIEHLQHLMEKSKVQLMKDFEIWWAEQAERAEAQSQQLHGKTPKAAWRTPPLSPITKSNGRHMSDESPPPLHNHSRKPPIPNHIRQSLAGGSTFVKDSDSRRYGDNKMRMSQSSENFNQRSESSSSSIPLTGDAQADADIMAFLKARQNIVRISHQNSNR